MTEPQPDDVERRVPPPAADPTLGVARPPVPGRAVRAEVAAGDRTTPPIRHDEPTVTLPGSVRQDPRRTLEFGVPAPVKVTVGPRPKRRRRYPTWPWIVAVVLALIVLGAVLLVMLLRGATVDGDTDLVGAGRLPPLGIGSSSPP
jgi:anti-sigma factor RsiW